MWSWYQGLSCLGGKFSHVKGKPSVSVSQIFGYYFFGQNGTSPFIMDRGYPSPPPPPPPPLPVRCWSLEEVKWLKGMLCLPRFPIFLNISSKSKGVNVAWECLITLSNRWYMSFLTGKVSYFCKTAKLDSFVLSEYEKQQAYQIMFRILSWSSVTHCFKLLLNVWYRTTDRIAPDRWQKFESRSSGSQSVLLFLGPHVLALFFIIFIILRGLLHLI